MSRNFRPIKVQRTVMVECIDTGKVVEADIVTEKPDYIMVELTGGLRISLQKHATNKGIYVGEHSGLTFECNIDD